MWWKVLGVALVLLVVGMATGYAVGDSRTDSVSHHLTPGPVAAVSPSYPEIPTISPLPDPALAPLQVGLPSTLRHFRTGKHGNDLTAAVPDGWVTTRQSATRWTFALPDPARNTYGMRIDVIAGLHESVSIHRDSRIAAYREAQRNEALDNFTIENETADTFVATYVEDGYLRVTMERVLALGGSSAYADIAVTGREADRQGLMDLLASTTSSMVPE